jgi:NTP pyrophosphatase (non-canonical NTP hydrolase)
LNPEYIGLIERLEAYLRSRNVTIPVQIIKVQEELGEVAEAFVGFMGLNPRKGITHTPEDVALELADVVMTALVGIKMAGFEPDYILGLQAKKAEERLNDAA